MTGNEDAARPGSAPARRAPAERVRAALLAVLGVLLLSAGLHAQAEGFVTFQFSFSNPGARSLGFGGAFVALADDATAAFANPAGLVQLIEPEVSVEARQWGYSTPYVLGGRIDGEPTGIGIDTSVGLRTAESNDRLTGLSFLSYVYPKNRWSVAVYRHELARFELSSRTEAVFRATEPPDPPGLTSRSFDVRAATDSRTVGWGFAAGCRVTDELSLGAGITFFDSMLSSTSELFLPDSAERFFEANSYLSGSEVATWHWSIDYTDFGLTGGFLWQASKRWRVGGFYRQGPRLRLDGELIAGPSPFSGAPRGTLLDELTSDIEFPDVYGLGAAYRSGDGRLLLSFEWDRLEYSRIIESVQFNPGLALDDGDELRLGGEYVFLDRTPVFALRAGAWLDPDHRTYALPDQDRLTRALFRPGDDELHVSFGLGLALPTVQLDLAVDISELVDTVSLSTIYSF